MSTLPLPDVDALVRGALTAALGPGVTVMTLWPDDWAERLPLVVARRVPGAGALDPRGLDAAIVDVQAAAADRTQASLLARRALAALYDAAVSQYADAAAGGYLSHYAATGTGPSEIRTGAPAPSAQSFRFQATARLTARSSPAP